MNDEQGFTLIELLIVIGIIAILTAAAVSSYVGVTRKAARSEAYGNLESLRLLEEQFYSENGNYSPTAADIDAIQNDLPGFRPGNDAQFEYEIKGVDGSAVIGYRLPDALTIPFKDSTVVTQNNASTPPDPPCFVAIATALPGTRVFGDVFAIDCFNRRNF